MQALHIWKRAKEVNIFNLKQNEAFSEVHNETFFQKKRDFILKPKASIDYQANCVFYLRFCVIVVRDEWSFCHVHFCDGDRKRQNSRNKLPEYRRYVAEDMKQSDLNGANLLDWFHHVTKGSKCKEHCIKAIEITSDNESSIVGDRFWQAPRDYSEYKGH